MSRLDRLAAEVTDAELTEGIEARRADLAAGLVPEGVRRALLPHEIRAGTNFAEIESDVDAAASVIAPALQPGVTRRRRRCGWCCACSTSTGPPASR